MNGINYEYIKNKEDITVVFLHGWGLTGNAFNQIISRLDERLSVLKVDLPGFGLSREPESYFDTYEYSYQIFLLLKKLNINKIIFVGHSFGGRLVILLSSVFGLDIKCSILTSSAGLIRFNLLRWLKVKKYKFFKWLVSKKIIGSRFLNNSGSDDYKNASLRMKAVLRNVVNQDLICFVKKIQVDVILVWDKKDKDTPYWICKKIFRCVKTSKIINYKSGGHFTVFYNIVKFTNILNDM